MYNLAAPKLNILFVLWDIDTPQSLQKTDDMDQKIPLAWGVRYWKKKDLSIFWGIFFDNDN